MRRILLFRGYWQKLGGFIDAGIFQINFLMGV